MQDRPLVLESWNPSAQNQDLEALRSYNITRGHRDPLGQHFPKHGGGQHSSNKGFCAQQTWKLNKTKPVALLQDFSGPLKCKCALLLFKGGCSISHSPAVLD